MVNKGQTQLVTAILLTGILIALVTIAYFWGIPLIEKQKDSVRVDNMESLFLELDDKIQSVAKNGGKENIEGYEVMGTMRFLGDGINDNITASFETSGGIIATGTDIYLAGSGAENPPVGSEPGVVKVYAEKAGKKYDINMKLYYRNLTTAEDIYKIDLEAVGRRVVGEGKHSIVIEEAGSETIENKKKLHLTKVKIRFN